MRLPAGCYAAGMIDRSTFRSGPGDSAPQDEIEGALARALRESSTDEVPIQTDLPVREVPSYDLSGARPLFAILEILFWLFVIAAVVYAGIHLVKSWIDRRSGDGEESEDEEAALEETLAGSEIDIDLAQVRALADEGRYGDAVHLLLQLTFQSLCELAGTELRPAWTSREILGEIPLPRAGQDALRALVAAVELSHFGGVAATREDYERSLARFDDFVATLKSGARA